MLVDKNIPLLDELIQMSETAIDAHRYIDQLETEIANLKSKKTESEINSIPTMQFVEKYIYRPKITYETKKKCNKCNDDGLIKQHDDFYTRTILCDCRKLIPRYDVEELRVVSTTYVNSNGDVITYDCFFGDNLYSSVNREFIYNNFDKEQLSFDGIAVFYMNKEDCDEYCRRKNNETD